MRFQLFFSLLPFFQAIFINLNQKDTCFLVTGDEKETLNIQYVVSGESEDNVVMRLFDEENNVIYRISKLKEGQFKESLPYTGKYNVCFQTTNSYPSVLSFDFQLSKTHKDYILPETLQSFTENTKEVLRNFRNIYRNQHFQSERESIHQKIQDQTVQKIKHLTLLKVGLVIVISLIQLYLIKYLIKDKQGSNV